MTYNNIYELRNLKNGIYSCNGIVKLFSRYGCNIIYEQFIHVTRCSIKTKFIVYDSKNNFYKIIASFDGNEYNLIKSVFFVEKFDPILTINNQNINNFILFKEEIINFLMEKYGLDYEFLSDDGNLDLSNMDIKIHYDPHAFRDCVNLISFEEKCCYRFVPDIDGYKYPQVNDDSGKIHIKYDNKYSIFRYGEDNIYRETKLTEEIIKDDKEIETVKPTKDDIELFKDKQILSLFYNYNLRQSLFKKFNINT